MTCNLCGRGLLSQEDFNYGLCFDCTHPWSYIDEGGVARKLRFGFQVRAAITGTITGYWTE
jgi:hypothetical protein